MNHCKQAANMAKNSFELVLVAMIFALPLVLATTDSSDGNFWSSLCLLPLA